MNLQYHKNLIAENGFTVINNIFSDEEIEKISEVIQNIDTSKTKCKDVSRTLAWHR